MYFLLSRHYKWALEQVFDVLGYQYAIILGVYIGVLQGSCNWAGCIYIAAWSLLDVCPTMSWQRLGCMYSTAWPRMAHAGWYSSN
jgi:hypothetical protein